MLVVVVGLMIMVSLSEVGVILLYTPVPVEVALVWVYGLLSVCSVMCDVGYSVVVFLSQQLLLILHIEDGFNLALKVLLTVFKIYVTIPYLLSNPPAAYQPSPIPTSTRKHYARLSAAQSVISHVGSEIVRLFHVGPET